MVLSDVMQNLLLQILRSFCGNLVVIRRSQLLLAKINLRHKFQKNCENDFLELETYRFYVISEKH